MSTYAWGKGYAIHNENPAADVEVTVTSDQIATALSPVTPDLDSGDYTLNEVDEAYWGNGILFRLALALGFDTAGPEGARVIEADPDEVLEAALEAIWAYRELCK